MSGVKKFFQKLGSDTKKFFSKGGMADVGLRKFGKTLTKAGGFAQSIAPILSVVAPEIGLPLLAGGALAKTVGKTSQDIRRGAQRGRDIASKTSNISRAITSGIEAGRPSVGQLEQLNFA